MNPNRTSVSTLRHHRSKCPGASGLPRRLAAAALGTLIVATAAGSLAGSPVLARSAKARVVVKRTHRVVRGDTAVGIARRYRISLQDLLQANNIKDPDLVKAGSVLAIPKAGYAARLVKAKAAPAPVAAKAPPAEAKAPVARAKPAEPAIPAAAVAAVRAAPPKSLAAPKVTPAPAAAPVVAPPVRVAEASPVTVEHSALRDMPVAVVARATTLPRVDTVRRTGETIVITPSRSRLLAVQGATRVQIDDAAGVIAEVQPLSTRELLILAKMPGSTMLRVWDDRGVVEHEVQVIAPSADMGAQITHTIGSPNVTARMAQDSVLLEGRVANAAEAARAEQIAAAFSPKVVNLLQVPAAPAPKPAPTPDVAEQVAAALKDPAITVEAVPGRADAVVLRGTAARTEDAERAARTASAFAQTVVNLIEVTRPDQVRVQVRMVDVDRRVLRELGIRWPDQATWGQETPDGEFRMLTSITASIRALIEENRANTLATPSLLVASGEKGEIVIGGRLPIPALITGFAGAGGGVAAPTGGTGTVGNGLLGQSVEFVDFGVKLQLAPVVLTGDEISLKLGTEVSAIDRSTAVTINGSVIPGFSTKRTDTAFRIRDGQTLVIGGLISKEEARAVHKFPILADIPVLGKFFQSVRKDNAERELIIFVTPQLVANGPVAAAAPDVNPVAGAAAAN